MCLGPGTAAARQTGAFCLAFRPGKNRGAMQTKHKDRLVNALLIVAFLAIVGGAAYFIFKTMTHWSIKGLGANPIRAAERG